MRDIFGEISVAVVLILLLGILFNPWQMAMSDSLLMILLTSLVVVFLVFSAFVWRENKGDERDVAHRLLADRYAYLAGSFFFLIGVVVQELQHTLDPWFLLGFAVMILAKVAGLIYGKLKM